MSKSHIENMICKLYCDTSEADSSWRFLDYTFLLKDTHLQFTLYLLFSFSISNS